MANDMGQELGRPKPQDVAKRWLKARGVEPTIGKLQDEDANPLTPASFIPTAYDLFSERQELKDRIVGHQRRMMEPEGQMSFGAISSEWDAVVEGRDPTKALTLEEKIALVKQGKINTLLPEVGQEKSETAVINLTNQKLSEIDSELDEVFSIPGVYQTFLDGLSHQVEIRAKAREVSGLTRFEEQAALLTLRLARRAQVEGRSLTSAEKSVIEGNNLMLPVVETRREELAQDPEVFDRLRIDELRRYRKQLDFDHFAETPSRTEYLERLKEYWAEGKRVLLSGESGTGKTELAKHASRSLFDVVPEYVTGHQDMSIYELLGKTGFQVKVGDIYRPAPMIRAMTGRDGQGLPFLFDEIDRAPNQAVMGIKTILNARPGEKGLKLQTDTAGTFDVGKDYAVVATANIKSAKHQTATELDPAIVRVFDAPVEVDYIPAPEVYDVALASLLDKQGGIPLSEAESTGMLKNLCDAASWIQDAYRGRKIVTDPGKNTFLEARGQGSTGKAASLEKAVLDPGRTIDMLKGWTAARARGISFEDYLNERIVEFINNRAYPEEDRYYLTEIFALKGFLAGTDVSELSVADLKQATLDKWTGAKRKKPTFPSGSLTSAKVARLDPYRVRATPVNQEAAELLEEEADETKDASTTRTAENSELSGYLEAQEVMGEDFFGLDEVENALGYKLDRGSMPAIPFSREELEKAKANGEFLMLFASDTIHNQPITMQRLNLHSKPATTPGAGKVLYDTSWYKDEEFFKTETPRTAWRLVSKDVIPDSTSKNYLDQTLEMCKYLEGTVFGRPLPADYDLTMMELAGQEDELRRLIDDDWQEAAKKLASLKINQMYRQTPVEALYANLVYSQNKGERLMENMYTWTNRLSSDGNLVVVGYFGSGGASVDDWEPGSSLDDVGVVLSR